MLARIAHDLYWLGRNLARAEFTARAVEAVFQAEVQGASDVGSSVSFGSHGLLAMLGDEVERERAGSAAALARLTLDAERPGSMLASVERAREGARTVRDVISAEMWEAINTTTLSLRGGGQGGWAPEPSAPTGPYMAAQYVKQRTALIWGVASRTMLRDEAKCFLDAGGTIEVSDMVLRMLRIALPPEDQAPADGHALILLQAVGGFHAYLRAVTAPPNAQPVARFLLFERAYPDSVAACVGLLARRLHHRRRRSSQLKAGLARQPPGGRPRLPATRPARRGRAARASASTPSRSSRASTPTWPSAILRAPQRPAGERDSALRDPLPDRIQLRRAGLGQPQRAACAPRDHHALNAATSFTPASSRRLG